jgi:hypothetical protein
MKSNLFKILFLALLTLSGSPAWADHGTLMSTLRDNWINMSVNNLVAEGIVPKPAKSVNELTNLEVAQLTAQAADMVVAQADLLPPPSNENIALPGVPLPEPQPALGILPAPVQTLPGLSSATATQNVAQLVQEFKKELKAMGKDLPQIEDRIYALEHENDSLAQKQQEDLQRTGTTGYGFSRGYFNEYRGFGASAIYDSADYSSVIFMDMGLQSIPVPNVLFNTTIRFYRTDGDYYADPITNKVDLRWISLSDFNEYFTLTAGDFFKHYTPLTLWNYEVPVYTFIEPTSFYRTRKDLEDFVYADHGPDWRLRGFQLSSNVDWPNSDVLSFFKLQAMGGPLKQATQYRFGDYYAGSQVSMSFFGDNLEVMGTGLVIWDDPNSSTGTPYNPNINLTWAQQYQIGSLSSRLNIPFAGDINLGGTVEWAGSDYQQDVNNPQKQFEDTAVMATGVLNISGFHMTAKYMNIGAYYYSPGAQTNRYTPGSGSGIYLTSNEFLDYGLDGYINNYPIQGVAQPSFAPYDRMEENMLPYGDASPNREGMVVGISADIGNNGWLKPQFQFVPDVPGLQMQEIQPNYVLSGGGTNVTTMDGDAAVPRTFNDYEGALTLNFAKAFDLKGKTYQISVDYKDQVTNLGSGLSPYEVDTFITSADFTVPIAGFDTVVLSAAFEQAISTGGEYTFVSQGYPNSLAAYQFYLDSPGQYAYTPLNITKTTWACGLMYPVSKTIDIRCDYFYNYYTWTDVPSFDRVDEIVRFTYDAHF